MMCPKRWSDGTVDGGVRLHASSTLAASNIIKRKKKKDGHVSERRPIHTSMIQILHATWLYMKRYRLGRF